MDSESVSEPRSERDAAAGGEAELDRLRRRVAELEQANGELRRANVRLARERIGPLDSAAAAELSRRGPSRPRATGRVASRVKAGLRALALRILR